MRTTTLIERSALARSSEAAFLTDGENRCEYRDLSRSLDAIRSQLDARGVDPAEVVALECSSTVPAALALLCLLEGGYRCVLWPQTRLSEALPGFCRHRLRARANPEDSGPALGFAPGIVVEENAQWNGARADARDETGRVYLLTSGSTGQPRLAVHDSGRLIDNAAGCVDRFELCTNDRVAIPVPIFHMYGLGAALLPALLAGASIDLQRDAHVLRFLAREHDFLPTVAFLTPSFCESLLATRKSPRAYRATVSAGDCLPEDVLSRYEERYGPLLNLYGCTELGAIAACAPSDALAVRMKSVGRLMPAVTLCPGTAVNGADSETRELRFRHEFGFRGYADEAGEPRLPDSAGDGGFATHDLGALTEGGYLRVRGRADHHVNRDGRLVALTEVEAALERIEGIARAAVVSSGRSRRGAALIAVCVPAAAGISSGRHLRRACLDVLPRHAIPDEFLLVSELPVLPSGKLDRIAIRTRYVARAATADEG